ncbi:MAG: hypothetical protein Q8S84_07730 [bacterium]|nr:hypothetical protein [bacterium]MDP3381331.1 hypothetical protein [bacterium]
MFLINFNVSDLSTIVKQLTHISVGFSFAILFKISSTSNQVFLKISHCISSS